MQNIFRINVLFSRKFILSANKTYVIVITSFSSGHTASLKCVSFFLMSGAIFFKDIIKLNRSHAVILKKSIFIMTQVCIMCVTLSFVRSFYIYWMHPVISVDSTKFIHQVEHEQLMDFFPFIFFRSESLYFPTCWRHF